MPQIGQFIRNPSGLSGRLRTACLDIELSLIPVEPSDTENTPDYRIHLDSDDGPEIGAGWTRTGERAGEYIAVVIDDPTLPQPIRANLFREDANGRAWSLHWSRPQRRGARA